MPNESALRLAERCFIAAFPNTAPANWRVFSVEAPKTGGHCRIDHSHNGEVPAYDWTFSRSDQDCHEPFVRVTNSYNGTRRFAIQFGLIRFKRTNGIVIWDPSVKLSFTHDERDIERRIEKEIDEAKFRTVVRNYQHQTVSLHATPVPIERIRPIVLSVLRFRKPEGMPQDREADWQRLETQIDDIAKKCVDEFGSNGDALLNTITEIATHPPTAEIRYNFIHRERHDFRRLAGVWLASFSERLSRPGFNLAAYLDDPSNELLGG